MARGPGCRRDLGSLPGIPGPMSPRPIAIPLSQDIGIRYNHFEGAIDGTGEARRDAAAFRHTATSGGRSVQHVPKAQGEGAPQPEDGEARVRDLRRPRPHAGRSVRRLWRAEAAPGARPVLRVLQAPLALGPRSGAGTPGAPRPPAPARVLRAQRQRQRRIIWSGPSETSIRARDSSGPPAVDASVLPLGDHASAVTTSLCPSRMSYSVPADVS